MIRGEKPRGRSLLLLLLRPSGAARSRSAAGVSGGIAARSHMVAGRRFLPASHSVTRPGLAIARGRGALGDRLIEGLLLPGTRRSPVFGIRPQGKLLIPVTRDEAEENRQDHLLEFHFSLMSKTKPAIATGRARCEGGKVHPRFPGHPAGNASEKPGEASDGRPSAHEAYDPENEEEHEGDLGDRRCRSCKRSESQGTGDESDHEKYECPV